MNSPHKGQWRGASIFLCCVWINRWINNREAGDLTRYRAHYDVTVMWPRIPITKWVTEMASLQWRLMRVYVYQITSGSLFPLVTYGFPRGPVMHKAIQSLRWRHNERDSVSNHQPHDCLGLLYHLFRRKSKKTSKIRFTGLCVGNSPVTGEFPVQMASTAENVSIWWRHHGYDVWCSKLTVRGPLA